jgi:hypothetical protein
MGLYNILEYIFSPLISDHNVDYKTLSDDQKHIHYSNEKLLDKYTKSKDRKMNK